MICVKCRSENSDSRKFCRECGNQLEIRCPQCSRENFKGDKYCGECGHNFSAPISTKAPELILDTKKGNVQEYLPIGLTESILAQKNRIEGEKRQITVMFCDMVGFTGLGEKFEAEEIYGLMSQVYKILIHNVNAYEGIVNELTGDGVLAFFGAPIALEDAPQRAIRSALSIHRDVSRFSERICNEKKISAIRMRIGIHSGPVVVGMVGNALKMEFKAIGDTVNLASRIESLAAPGDTYVTKDLFNLTEGMFRFEDLGVHKVKGKADPIHIYRVIGPSSFRTRFDVSAEKGLTPLVARERELGILLDAYRRVNDGYGHAVSIVSVAGMGKSRLLYEFRKAILHEDITFLEGKCLSFSKNESFHPLTDIIKSTFKIKDEDLESEIYVKVKTGLLAMGMDGAAVIPYLLELLSVADIWSGNLDISPTVRRERIIDAINRTFLSVSQLRPLILAIEDLHWSDNSTEDVIGEIIDNIPVEKVLLIFTYRPEYVPTWKTKSYFSQVTLSKLSNDECLTMAKHLLQNDFIGNDVIGLLSEKTEGVPFFIEEFIRSFVDLGIIEKTQDNYHLVKNIKNICIPSTIQDVTMSRVDVLSDSAKEILRAGSAIEREFSFEIIKKIINLPEDEFISSLAALKNAELIFQRGLAPESTYIFRHALTMEVVYDSMLDSKKKELHKSIGDSIEMLYKDNIEEHSATLGRHFMKAGFYEKAARYLKIAAKRARRVGSYGDAIEHSKRRIHALEQLPESSETYEQIIEARTILSSYYIGLNRHIEAKNAIDPIFDRAISLGYKKSLPGIFIAIGSYWTSMEDFDKAIDYLQQGIAAAHDVEDLMSVWIGNYFLGTTLSFTCQYEKAYECFKSILNLSEAGNNPVGVSFVKGTMGGMLLTFEGRVSEAYELSKDALQLAEVCGDIHTKAMAFSAHGAVCFFKGDLKKAKDLLTEAIPYCRKSGHAIWLPWAEFWLANTYQFYKEFGKAKELYQKSISSMHNTWQFSSWTIIHHLCLQKCIIEEGGIVDQSILSIDYRLNNKFKGFEGMIESTTAEVIMKTNPSFITEAEILIAKAIVIDEKNGTRWSLARDYQVLAEICLQKGDKIGAVNNLSKAINIMQKCGADGWVDKYHERLAQYEHYPTNSCS